MKHLVSLALFVPFIFLVVLAGCVPADETKYVPAGSTCRASENWASPTALRDNIEPLRLRMAAHPDRVKKHLDDLATIIACTERAR